MKKYFLVLIVIFLFSGCVQYNRNNEIKNAEKHHWVLKIEYSNIEEGKLFYYEGTTTSYFQILDGCLLDCGRIPWVHLNKCFVRNYEYMYDSNNLDSVKNKFPQLFKK